MFETVELFLICTVVIAVVVTLCCREILVSTDEARIYSEALCATIPSINIEAPTSPGVEVFATSALNCIKYVPGSIKFTVSGALNVREVPVELITVAKATKLPELTA